MSGTDLAEGLDEVVPGPSVITIGNFDGVHRGHQTLLRRTVDAAEGREVRAVAVTFEPHPAAVRRPGSDPPRLQTLDDRVASLAAAGVDLVLVLPFTRELAALDPAAFVSRVLVERLEAVRAGVGANFRFGAKAAGDVVTLVDEGERHGFDVEAVTLLEIDGVAISSTAVRDALAAGEVAWVAEALSRPHQLTGEVVRGDGRGATIGVPTANVAVPAGLQVPGPGVYAGYAQLDDGSREPCVTNVGVRPTFTSDELAPATTVEVHLIDASPQLLGRRLGVSFTSRLRGERRFEGVDALVTQIRTDIGTARDLLTT